MQSEAMIVAYGKNGKTVKSVKRIITGFTLFTPQMKRKDTKGH